MSNMARRLVLALALIPALTACNPFAVLAPTHEEIRAAGWVFPAAERSPTLAKIDPGFCYQTLAGIDCYTEPVPESAGQFVADPPILSLPEPYRR